MKKILLQVLFVVIICSLSLGMDSRRAPRDTEIKSPRQTALEILENAANSPDVLIRMGAIEAIAASQSAKLFPLIEQRLSDTVEAVRFTAILAVGDIGYSQVAGKINTLYENGSQNEKLAAAYAFLRFGDNATEHHRVIVSALQSHDSTTSANAALVMGKLGAKKYIGLLRWALQTKTGDDKTQIQAIESMARLGYVDIDSKAWALMISKRADDRVMGIITMYYLATYDSRNAIKTMLDDEVLEVRLIAAGRLGGLGERAGFDLLRQFFDEDLKKLSGEDRMRPLVHALDAIRFSADLELARYLPQFLDDKNESVRLHCAFAILSL